MTDERQTNELSDDALDAVNGGAMFPTEAYGAAKKITADLLEEKNAEPANDQPLGMKFKQVIASKLEPDRGTSPLVGKFGFKKNKKNNMVNFGE